MKRTLLTLLMSLTISYAMAQEVIPVVKAGDNNKPNSDVIIKPKYWTHKGNIGFNMAQSAYVNWSAGGQNALNFLTTFNYEINFAKDRWKWDNSFVTALGYSFYSFDIKKNKPIKTDDKIEITSLAGYKITDKLNASLEMAFRTQYAKGYDYAKDSSTYTSKFLAPAYLTLGLGIEWVPNEHFSLNFAPITGRLIIVNDPVLASHGAFGVNVIDKNDGEVHGTDKVRFEFGARLTAKVKYTIVKNVDFESKLELFSNYLNKPQFVDVDWQNLLVFKVNDWLNCNLSTHLIYDYDIPFYKDDGVTLYKYSRVQFKEVLAIGLMFNLK